MRRPIYSVILGVLFAAGALWFVYNSRPESANAAPVVQTTAVLVASKDIPFGGKIVADLVKTVQWPTASLPENAILERKDLLEGPEAPRIALRSFAAGEPFLKAKVSGFGEKPVLSRRVSEGMRAFTIRVNDVSGVAGFLLPGDRVDILLTRDSDGRGRDNLVTDVVLQNVTVLGIDQLANENAEKPTVAKSATVEVTPEQAQKLALAAQVGTLSLSLRNFTNVDETNARRITVGDLAERKPGPARRDDGVYVRVRKGTEVSSERVPQ
ncbi:MAG TPA: Flp pilus assembly protein CpaB [Parvularculaceae bacterium]|nr:Flp pilus assembly protein CpaB [Parvularculaceae bacterium]